MTIEFVDEAVASGARRETACEAIGLCARTLERWRSGKLEDERHGPKTAPANKLAPKERELVLKILNEPAHRDLSPNQIVPKLADEQRYVASESTMYRILREEDLLKHRGAMKAPQRRPPREHVAVGPNQVWSWDITYLKSPVRGVFFYLYMIVDVWSRKVVGWQVHDVESDDLAAVLFEDSCVVMKLDPRGIVLHADNGGPMKGSTMVATLERLGVLPSFSRPSVSNDNPYSESLFRTLKYRPEFPSKAFADVAAARTWVTGFVAWYNGVHRHSAICFVTPNERHDRKDATILANRHVVYETAKAKNPARWTSTTRNWAPVDEVHLNPADRNRSKRNDAPALGCVVECGAKGGAPADRGSPGVDDIDARAVDREVRALASDDAARTPAEMARSALPGPRRAAIASSSRRALGAPSAAQQRLDNATTRTTSTATTRTSRTSRASRTSRTSRTIADDSGDALRGHAGAHGPSRALDAHAAFIRQQP